MKELSLRPYHGRLFYVSTKKAYEKARMKLFKTPDVIASSAEGRFSGGCGHDAMWTYLVYAKKPHILAHELTHVLMHVWERCNIDPRDSGGEAFCYMLSQLMMEALDD